MSGIMAIVSLDGRPVPPELPRAQLAAIAHRGEWEPRLWEAPGVALGHVNLPRTPEAEREFLPMSDRTGRYWLTWDGRLDNRDELGPKLGYDVTERAEKTDAEYVLDSFIKWGDDCVHQLLGDWAVVIWDNESRRLFCANSPTGWRQLYIRTRPGLVCVSSEPSALFAPAAPKPCLDYVQRLLGGAIQALGATHLLDVRELQQGQQALITSTGLFVSAFWASPRPYLSMARQPMEYVEEFEALHHSAIRARLRSNRPIATFLSGGLDSSYITATAAMAGSEVTAFTLYVPNSKHLDERSYARLVAERFGVTLREVDTTECWYLSSKWLPDSSFDQPTLPGAGSSLRKLSDRAREHGAGVVLGGEGGDEWFGGLWARSPRAGITNAVMKRHLRAAVRIARGRPSGKQPWQELTAAMVEGYAPAAFQRRALRSQRLGGQDFSEWAVPGSDWVSNQTLVQPAGRSTRDDLDRIFRLYRQVGGPEVGWRDRHIFLGQGLELRSPFNDKRVVEMLASAPLWVKQYTGQRRALLRTCLDRVGLNEIGARSDKGHYAEQATAGIVKHERPRVSLGLQSLMHIPGLRHEIIQERLRAWESMPSWDPDTYLLSVTGLWIRQLWENQCELRTPLLESLGREEVSMK